MVNVMGDANNGNGDDANDEHTAPAESSTSTIHGFPSTSICFL